MKRKHLIFKEGKLEASIVLFPFSADDFDVRVECPGYPVAVHKIGDFLNPESNDTSPLSSFSVWFVMALEK